MKYLNKDQVIELYKVLANGDVYKKSGRMIARPAQIGETLLTVVSGKLETLKATQPGDWVIQNIMVGSSAENYPISGDSFAKRYSVKSEDPWLVNGNNWYEVEPKGQITGGFYDWNAANAMNLDCDERFDLITGNPIGAPTIKFEAPWGEDMILEDGDYLGRPYPAADLNDIYRVARTEFFQTYGEEPAFAISGATTPERV